ncbi:MAG TPA: hypothetical protein ENK77_02295 [Epsilonproteobacteria bacterium]|nr:hypothetical protein [Campylobacterota bacterium]
MSTNKRMISVVMIVNILMLGACSSTHKGPKFKKPMDTSGKSPVYVRGAEDGCATANGDYTKNHEDFNNNIEYHEGWFAGRRYCEVRNG